MRNVLTVSHRTHIRQLNDAFRKTFVGGQVVMTASLAAEDERVRAAVLQAVADFESFTRDSDPYGQHDWGSFTLFGQTWNWKVDYYDKKLEFGSEDPADPDVTARVLTIGPLSDF